MGLLDSVPAFIGGRRNISRRLGSRRGSTPFTFSSLVPRVLVRVFFGLTLIIVVSVAFIVARAFSRGFSNPAPDALEERPMQQTVTRVDREKADVAVPDHPRHRDRRHRGPDHGRHRDRRHRLFDEDEQRHDDKVARHPVDKLKLPTPVIVMGMPKSGTTSINFFFKCGGMRSSHFACDASGVVTAGGPQILKVQTGETWRNCRLPEGSGGLDSSAGEFPLCGVCVERNIMAGRPPLEGCGDYDVWAELDSAEHPLPTRMANEERKARNEEEKQEEMADKVVTLEEEEGKVLTEEEARELAEAAGEDDDDGEDDGKEDNDEKQSGTQGSYDGVRPLCAYPQITRLQEIHDAYPNATFILNIRPTEKWIASISKWTGDSRRAEQGYLRQVFTKCEFPGFPSGTGATDEELKLFYEGHTKRVKDFVRNHPSHTLVEVHIEDPNSAKVLEDAFGISSECWEVRNASPGQKTHLERGFNSPERRSKFEWERFTERDKMRKQEDFDKASRKSRYDRLHQSDHRRLKERSGESNLRTRRHENFIKARRRSRHDLRQEERRREDDLRMRDHVLKRHSGRSEAIHDFRHHLPGRRDELVEHHRRGRRERRGRQSELAQRMRFRRYPFCENTEDLFGTQPLAVESK